MNTIIAGLQAADAVLGEAKGALDTCRATIEQLHRQLAMAQAAENYWQQAYADAWILIGRIDYFLETHEAQTPVTRRRIAAQLRKEIKTKAGIT